MMSGASRRAREENNRGLTARRVTSCSAALALRSSPHAFSVSSLKPTYKFKVLEGPVNAAGAQNNLREL